MHLVCEPQWLNAIAEALALIFRNMPKVVDRTMIVVRLISAGGRAGGFLLHVARSRGVCWWVNLSASPSPYLDLSMVIRALRGAVGGWGFLGPALMMLLYRRLGGICGDMERLSARFQAGRLWRVLARAEGVGRAGGGGPARGALGLGLPRGFGWLVRIALYRAAGYGSQLRVILAQPEMVALLMAAPQAGRILRPLCRMLAVEAALLRPRPAGEAVLAEVAPVVQPRVRVPRPVVDFGRIPLPRGVIAAARRQGIRKGG